MDRSGRHDVEGISMVKCNEDMTEINRLVKKSTEISKRTFCRLNKQCMSRVCNTAIHTYVYADVIYKGQVYFKKSQDS